MKLVWKIEDYGRNWGIWDYKVKEIYPESDKMNMHCSIFVSPRQIFSLLEVWWSSTFDWGDGAFELERLNFQWNFTAKGRESRDRAFQKFVCANFAVNVEGKIAKKRTPPSINVCPLHFLGQILKRLMINLINLWEIIITIYFSELFCHI